MNPIEIKEISFTIFKDCIGEGFTDEMVDELLDQTKSAIEESFPGAEVEGCIENYYVANRSVLVDGEGDLHDVAYEVHQIKEQVWENYCANA